MASLPPYHEENFFHENRKYPLDVLNRSCYTHPKFRRSSAVEQLTVNQLVVGSIPTAGANYKVSPLEIIVFLGAFCYSVHHKGTLSVH